MKLLILAILGISLNAFSYDNGTIITDLKLLCEINKIEKALAKDAAIDSADLAERIRGMKEGAFRDKATKEALEAISKMADSDHAKTWKEFAKQHKVSKISCLK